MTKQTEIPPIIMPYYFGDQTQYYGPALLWFGKLQNITAPWCSPYPVQFFCTLKEHAKKIKHPMIDLILVVEQCLNLSYNISIKQKENIDLLDERILMTAGVGPGGQARYKTIQSEFQASTQVASKLLNDFEYMRIACCQFVWRSYEYYLELSNNVSEALMLLWSEEKVLNGKSNLLAECL